MRTILFLLVNTLVLFGLAAILPGFGISNVFAAIIFLVVIAVLDYTLIPLLQLISLPINFLTFGLVGWLINLLAFWIADSFVDGIVIEPEGLGYFFYIVIISFCLSAVSPAIVNLINKEEV
jgi:putative membrane protein